MSFEWLSTDDAARTLGVEVPTLNQWIESGRAPSRKQNNRIEVLIEFDEDEDDSAQSSKQSVHVESFEQVDEPNPNQRSGDDAPDYQQMQLVHQRELQMAGGMVAAWQRLAETADQELSRTRRLNTAGWATVATLTIAIIAGVVWGLNTINQARTQMQLTESDLTRTATDLDTARQQQATQDAALLEQSAAAAQLREQLASERQQLATTEATLAATKARAELLEAANTSLRTDTATLAETNQAAIKAVSNVNDQLLDQINTLRAERAEAARIAAEQAAEASEQTEADPTDTEAPADSATPQATQNNTRPNAAADQTTETAAEAEETQPLISTTRQDVPPDGPAPLETEPAPAADSSIATR